MGNSWDLYQKQHFVEFEDSGRYEQPFTARCWCGKGTKAKHHGEKFNAWKAAHAECQPLVAKCCRKCGARSHGLCDACIAEEMAEKHREDAQTRPMNLDHLAWSLADAEPVAKPKRCLSAVQVEQSRTPQKKADRSPFRQSLEERRPLPATERQKARARQRMYDTAFMFKFFVT